MKTRLSPVTTALRTRYLRRALAATAALGLGMAAPLAPAQAPVDASQHSCAELGQMVQQAGTLKVNARTRNPNGQENLGLHTFIASGQRCDFLNDRPSQWRIYAKSDEICDNLNKCLPRSLGR